RQARKALVLAAAEARGHGSEGERGGEEGRAEARRENSVNVSVSARRSSAMPALSPAAAMSARSNDVDSELRSVFRRCENAARTTRSRCAGSTSTGGRASQRSWI